MRRTLVTTNEASGSNTVHQRARSAQKVESRQEGQLTSEIRIPAYPQPSLHLINSRHLARPLACPLDDLPHPEASPGGLGPEEGATETQRADAPPSRRVVAGVKVLKLRDAWGMVRDDVVDGSVEESTAKGGTKSRQRGEDQRRTRRGDLRPKEVSIRGRADGRAAFKLGVTVRDCFRFQTEVVVARLNS